MVQNIPQHLRPSPAARVSIAVALLVMVSTAIAQQTGPRQGTQKPQEVKKPQANRPDAPANRADKPRKDASKEKKSSKGPRRATTVTPEQVAAVNALVSTHHPDLATLLAQLKAARPSQYAQAVRSLFRTSVRLASIQERDMERYDLELKRWKLESQSQLLALKLVRAKDDVKLHEELKSTTQLLLETRIALTELDRARQKERLDKLDEQLSELRTDQEGRVKANVDLLLRSAKSLAQAQKSKSKSTKKSSPVNVRKSKSIDRNAK